MSLNNPMTVNYGLGQPPGVINVTDTSTEIVSVNTSRKWCFIYNDGNHDIYMAVGQTAVLGKGFLLQKMGGSTLLDSTIMSNQQLNGITKAGQNANVVFQEGN